MDQYFQSENKHTKKHTPLSLAGPRVAKPAGSHVCHRCELGNSETLPMRQTFNHQGTFNNCIFKVCLAEVNVARKMCSVALRVQMELPVLQTA